MSAIYSASQIIGKSLIANSEIGIKRIASDSAAIVYTVKRNQPVGVVYSYLNPNQNRNGLYWMFKDSAGGYYYTEHKEGLFSIESLKAQGTLTIEEEIKKAAEDKEKAQKDGFDKTKEIVTLALYGVAAWAGVTLLTAFKK